MEKRRYLIGMDLKKLRKVIQARPFRPFFLRLLDGREIWVGHPENIMVPTDGLYVVVDTPGEGIEILDVPLMTAIDIRRKRRRA